MPDWSGAVRAGVLDASLANSALEFSPATDPNTVAPHAPATPDKKSLRLIAIRISNPNSNASRLERACAKTSTARKAANPAAARFGACLDVASRNGVVDQKAGSVKEL
jgi:hypothetical protein